MQQPESSSFMGCNHMNVIHQLTFPLFFPELNFGNSALEPGWPSKRTQMREEDYDKSKPAVFLFPMKAVGEALGKQWAVGDDFYPKLTSSAISVLMRV